MVSQLKLIFSHFKQFYTYFNTFFHLHIYQKHQNNIIQIILSNEPLISLKRENAVTNTLFHASVFTHLKTTHIKTTEIVTQCTTEIVTQCMVSKDSGSTTTKIESKDY